MTKLTPPLHDTTSGATVAATGTAYDTWGRGTAVDDARKLNSFDGEK